MTAKTPYQIIVLSKRKAADYSRQQLTRGGFRTTIGPRSNPFLRNANQRRLKDPLQTQKTKNDKYQMPDLDKKLKEKKEKDKKEGKKNGNKVVDVKPPTMRMNSVTVNKDNEEALFMNATKRKVSKVERTITKAKSDAPIDRAITKARKSDIIDREIVKSKRDAPIDRIIIKSKTKKFEDYIS